MRYATRCNPHDGGFVHNGESFTFTSEIVDTSYGPERRMEFFNIKGERVKIYSECMNADMLIEQFKKNY